MKRILVIVDMQNDFLSDQVLGNKECREAVPAIIQLLNRESYDYLFLTRDTHSSKYLSTQEGKNLPVPHCIQGTEGWEIDDHLWKYVQAYSPELFGGKKPQIEIIDKNTFGSMVLAERVRKLADEEEICVDLAGVCTGICVISNAMLLKAAVPEVIITVYKDCCACVTPKSHQTALEAMEMCQIRIKDSSIEK